MLNSWDNNTPLADKDVAMWAARSYWKPRPAILLIMGLEPENRKSEYYIEEGDPKRYELGNRYNHLLEIIGTAVFSGDIEGHLVTDPDDGHQSLFPYPQSTIKYLVSKGVEVDERVRDAVLKADEEEELYLRSRQPDEQIGYNIDSVSRTTADHEYCFKKNAKGWDLKFEDVVLSGVKDWEGMKYIKILLQYPGEMISVLKLQSLVGVGGSAPYMQGGEGVDNDEASESDIDPFVSDDSQTYNFAADNSAPKSRVNTWEVLDKQAIQAYKESLGRIEEQLNVAKSTKIQNRSKIERLEKDKAAIEAQLNNANYKDKDPTVEKARKYVLKTISYTINNISKLEALCNYNDRPISSHLKRYIQTGVSCSYNIKKEEAPTWKY